MGQLGLTYVNGTTFIVNGFTSDTYIRVPTDPWEPITTEHYLTQLAYDSVQMPVGGYYDDYLSYQLDSEVDERVGTFLVNTSPVPLPAGVWLFGSGLLGLIGIARRKKS